MFGRRMSGRPSRVRRELLRGGGVFRFLGRCREWWKSTGGASGTQYGDWCKVVLGFSLVLSLAGTVGAEAVIVADASDGGGRECGQQ